MTRLLAALLLFCFAAPAAAQDPPPDARRLFEEGVALIEDQRYSDAAAALEASLAIRETPPVLYNLAIAYRGMGAYRRAITAFERFGELAGSERRFADLRETVPAILIDLRASLVHLRVTVRGGATEVRVDGEAAPTTEGTFEVVTDPGRHTVIASRPGHRPQERGVETQRGQTVEIEIDAAAEPLPGQLVIEVEPASAAIAVEGRRAGIGRVEQSVQPGTYDIHAEARGYVPEERSVEIGPGASQRVAITLSRVARPAQSGLTGRWWFWTAIGVAVVGTAAVIAVAAQPGPEPYERGTLGFVVQALNP